MKATIYLWLPVPPGHGGDSGAFCRDLLKKKGVMVTPGRGYGETGEGTSERCSDLPTIDARSEDEILGYSDEELT